MQCCWPAAVAAEQQSTRVLSFRRVEYTCHPAAFWAGLIGDPAADPNRKSIISMKRAEVPDDVRRTATTAEQQEAAGAEAAQRSLASFMGCVDTIKSSEETSKKVLMVGMKHVGIKCEGRSGPYDLLYFVRTDALYAADSRDDAILYRMC
jgi:hypothetical protein